MSQNEAISRASPRERRATMYSRDTHQRQLCDDEVRMRCTAASNFDQEHRKASDNSRQGLGIEDATKADGHSIKILNLAQVRLVHVHIANYTVLAADGPIGVARLGLRIASFLFALAHRCERSSKQEFYGISTVYVK
jgi:hypothetical protein